MDKQIDHDALFEDVLDALEGRAKGFHAGYVAGNLAYGECTHAFCKSRKTHDTYARAQLSELGAAIDTDRAELDNLRELKVSQDQMIHELSDALEEAEEGYLFEYNMGNLHRREKGEVLDRWATDAQRQRQRTADAYTLLIAEENKSEALHKRLAEQHAEIVRLRSSVESLVAIDGEFVNMLQKERKTQKDRGDVLAEIRAQILFEFPGMARVIADGVSEEHMTGRAQFARKIWEIGQFEGAK